MTAQISVVAGSQHVMVLLPDDTYLNVEPNSQHTVQLDGAGLVGISQVGEEEEPPDDSDVKAFFIRIFQAVMDRIRPPAESTSG